MDRNAFLRLIAGILPAATIACKGEELAEASTNLDLSKFPPVLQAVSKLVDSGFNEEQVRSTSDLAKQTPVGESRRRDFPVTHRGRKTLLRIEFKRDDEDALDVWFFTAPDLAKVIQQRMIEIAEQ